MDSQASEEPRESNKRASAGEPALDADEALRRRKLNADVEKVEFELAELRKPYILRNPQVVTSLIATLGAIAGIFVLLQNNYFQNLNTSIQLKEQEAKIAERESRERVRQAEERSHSAQLELESKTQEVGAKERQLTEIEKQRSQMAAELEGLRRANVEASVDRSVMLITGVLREVYLGPERTEPASEETEPIVASPALRAALSHIPPERIGDVAEKLLRIKETDIPHWPFPEVVHSDAEKSACLYAVLFALSGNTMLGKRLSDATSTFLRAGSGSSFLSCVAYRYRALPPIYDPIRRDVLRSALTAAESGHFLRSPENAIEFLQEIFVQDRDLMAIGDLNLVRLAVVFRTLTADVMLGGSFATQTGASASYMGPVVPSTGFFDQMQCLAILNALLVAEGRRPTEGLPFPEKLVAGVILRSHHRYARFPNFNIAPVQRKPTILNNNDIFVSLSPQEAETLKGWRERNLKTTNLLLRGSAKEIVDSLSHDQVSHLANNEWISDQDLRSR